MLKIRVLGSGLIPRIGTLAPKKEPFLADANLIQIILYTKGLKPQYFDPAKETFADLTLVNFKKVYAKLGNELVPKPKQTKNETKKVVESVKTEEVVPALENRQLFSKKDKFSKKNKFQRQQEQPKVEIAPEVVESLVLPQE